MPQYRVFHLDALQHSNIPQFAEVFQDANALFDNYPAPLSTDLRIVQLKAQDPNEFFDLSPRIIQELLEGWQELQQAKEIAWSMGMEASSDAQGVGPTTADTIDYKGQVQRAAHYQNFIDDYQWIDAEMRKPYLRDDLSAASKALSLQISKYLSREGRKDDVIKENLKAVWYIHYKVAMLLEGGPIKADDVPAILKKHGFL